MDPSTSTRSGNDAGPDVRDQSEHVRFLNAFYSRVHSTYDVTRKFFLFGRDPLLDTIVALQPRVVIEVGCGTGRNLAKLRERLPGSQLSGVEPCEAMRQHALKKHPWLAISRELGETADLPGLTGQRPDVVFFSYTLSMVRHPEAAVANCVAALGPQGRVFVLDFGDLRGLGRWGGQVFRRWLHLFHVHPEAIEDVLSEADEHERGPFGYWHRALFLGGERTSAIGRPPLVGR
jgi:S-adenosylmethionine-diacylgycerolhomoserine-N-methlytransferase